MGSKGNGGFPLFFSLNLLIFVLVSTTFAKHVPITTPPPPSTPIRRPPPPSVPIRRPPPPSTPKSPPPPPVRPISRPPPPSVPIRRPPPPSTPRSPPPPPRRPPPPSVPNSPPPPPSVPNSPPPPPVATCPRNVLRLGVCANVLKSLLGIVIGNPPKTPCCSLIQGLVDLEAAVCLCTAIRANILGINLNVPLSISLLLNACGKSVPPEFQCG